MSKNPLHVEFSNRGETIVAFSHDRGVLKTNSYGDYFFRGCDDGRFACLSPELERILIDTRIYAGERVSIKKVTRNRIATWEVKRLDAPVESPAEPRKVWPRKNGKPVTAPLPERCYSEPAPASEVQTAPAPVEPPHRTAPSQPITSDSLLGRCLCEALDACKIAQDHASKIGLPVVFGPDQIEAMGVSIFIARTRDGAIVDRMPPARQTSGRVNGAAYDVGSERRA